MYQGGLYFYVEEGRLFCKNAERGHRVFELRAITDTLFILDEEVQVEFEKDPQDVYLALKVHGKDGTLSKKAGM